MSLPETCPFCGAEPYTTASGEQCRGGDRWVLFSCDTSIYAGQDLRRTQSRKCEMSERNRLLARVAELEAHIKRLEEALDTLTLVVGLTPIAGNKEALQQSLDLARAELKAKEAKP